MNHSVKKGRPEHIPEFITGWGLVPLRIRFGTSMLKYYFLRKEYPLFKSRSLNLIRKNRMLAMNKVIRFGNHYYAAVMRVPRWPSPAFDRMVANGGLNIDVSGTPLKKQIDSVIVAVTRKCSYRCRHCYEYNHLSMKDSVTVQRLKETVREIQDMGASVVVLSGGEPMLRYPALLELLESGDKKRSDFHVHTSGHGVTVERALELRNAGLTAAAVGLDDVDPKRHDRFRGYEGAHREALKALECFSAAGIFTYSNLCLHGRLVRSGGLREYLELAKGLNVGTVLLLEPKPCGRYFSKDTDGLFSETDRIQTARFYRESNRDGRYRNYPMVSYMSYLEHPQRLGCLMAGLSHLYINSVGDVQPCVFLPVTFGNIMRDTFYDIYRKMRMAAPGPVRKGCPAVLLSRKMMEKKGKAVSFPVPFETIEKEWFRMFEIESRR